MFKPLLQGFGKALLLLPQGVLHPLPGRAQHRMGAAHDVAQGGRQPVKKRFVKPQLDPMPRGAADNAAQHIAPPLVGRRDAVRHQKRAGADMVAQDLGGHRLSGAPPRQVMDSAGQWLEQVCVVVVANALQHRGDPFQAHARVNRRLGQGLQAALGVPVELHEDQVPDLHEAVAIRVGAARRPPWRVRAVVVKNLAARAARAGLAHGPEIVGLPAPAEAALGDAYLLQPYPGGLVIVLVHGDPEFFLGERQFAAEKIPGVAYGLLLEIIAEAEIAQHLKEGVVAGRAADILQVVVLAPGPQATLGGGGAGAGALFAAKKRLLELHHAGVSEQQGRVIGGHQGRTRRHFMPALFEIVQEPGAYVVAACHLALFERVANLRGSEAAMFQKTGLPRPLLQVLRRWLAEFFPPNRANPLPPVRRRQQRLRQGLRHAAFAQFVGDANRAETPGDPLVDIGLGVASIVLQAFRLEGRHFRFHFPRVKIPRQQLLSQFSFAMLSPGQQFQGLFADRPPAALPLRVFSDWTAQALASSGGASAVSAAGLGKAVSLTACSISAASSGFSDRCRRILSFPWASRSPL